MEEDKQTPDAEDAQKIAIRETARIAVAEQYHTLEHFREVFRKFSQKRRQPYHFPFVLSPTDVEIFDRAIRSAIERIESNIPVTFSGSARLKSRREISFRTSGEITSWDEPEKSHAVQLLLNWKYTYHPEEAEIPIPLVYDVAIEFETEPDHAEKERLSIEESIVLHIEGPDIQWVRALQEVLEEAIKSTKMPAWWVWLRYFIVKMRPFINNGIYLSLLFLAWMWWGIFSADKKKAEVADQIYKATDFGAKFDLYIQWWAKPPEFFKFMFFMMVAMVVVGALHLLIMLGYNYIAPPSVLAIGLKGKRRKGIAAVYGAVWMLIIASIVGALISKIL